MNVYTLIQPMKTHLKVFTFAITAAITYRIKPLIAAYTVRWTDTCPSAVPHYYAIFCLIYPSPGMLQASREYPEASRLNIYNFKAL
jgi:hypothetical protein